MQAPQSFTTAHPLRRRILGAILLDLAVSPLFIWNVFAQPLSRELGVSATQLSLVFSLGLVAFSAGVLVGGRLADRLDPRHLALFSAMGTLGGLGLSAVAPSLWLIALGFGVVQGLAAGIGYATAVHEASLINRGLVVALVVSAYGAGSAVLASPAAWLLEYAGRGPAFAALAIITATTCAIAAWLLPGKAPGSGRQNVTTPFPPSQRRLIALLWLMFGLASAPGLAAFAIAGELSATAAYGAVAAISLGNLSGRLIAGPLSDRTGTPPALHAGFALLVMACALFLIDQSP